MEVLKQDQKLSYQDISKACDELDDRVSTIKQQIETPQGVADSASVWREVREISHKLALLHSHRFTAAQAEGHLEELQTRFGEIALDLCYLLSRIDN